MTSLSFDDGGMTQVVEFVIVRGFWGAEPPKMRKNDTKILKKWILVSNFVYKITKMARFFDN